jgi:hypothetical protein
MLGKGKTTIMRHFRKDFPYSGMVKGKALKLSIEEQITIIQSFPKHFVVRGAKKNDLPKNEADITKNEADLFKNEVDFINQENSNLPLLSSAERVQVFGMLLDYMKREEDKYRQEKENRNLKLIDIFLKIAGLPTLNEEKMGYILTQLSYETIKNSDDDDLKKLSLIYKENSNDN